MFWVFLPFLYCVKGKEIVFVLFVSLLKVCKMKNPKVCAKGSYSLLKKTLLLHCLINLVWSQTFTFMCVTM